jgi:hypothetical protein
LPPKGAAAKLKQELSDFYQSLVLDWSLLLAFLITG